MSFEWPIVLLGLGTLPLIALAYMWALRRRLQFASEFSDLALIRRALPDLDRWRQHIPFLLLVLTLASLIIASARPQVVTKVPLSQTSIILAIDVSRSMCAVDVEPNRLGVAQVAAQRFVEDQVDTTPVGLVTFAGSATLLVPPTRDATTLTAAITDLSTSFGTAIGSATLASIDAISEINDDVVPTGTELAVDEAAQPAPVPDVVVILTDGANSSGSDPLKAADQAAARGVRVFTIGFGTTEPTQMVCSPQQTGITTFADERYDPNGGGGFVDFVGAGANTGTRQLLVIDEPTLKSIAETTGGEYYRAASADQLTETFAGLPSRLALTDEVTEVSVGFIALAAVSALAALGVSWLLSEWPHGRRRNKH